MKISGVKARTEKTPPITPLTIKEDRRAGKLRLATILPSQNDKALIQAIIGADKEKVALNIKKTINIKTGKAEYLLSTKPSIFLGFLPPVFFLTSGFMFLLIKSRTS